MKEEIKDGKFMGSAKVGPKGQIVIPKEVRDMFGISPGDTLIVLADAERGIAIERFDTFNQIADAIFSGKAKQLYPDHTEEDSISFAKSIKAIREGIDDE
ncbi:AbrB/MazE/SpoVT family DNA-binding domain-containing protein [Rubeoparvulum massiliense]|uniref:AbrB/MazE/SpoVT family DNA-binding domain-containing protein n=1 Tax=Rubeoparvulum massiliense TaxID=1631346 RepID=UPI00065E55B0|nr:AbrB/MazE/SpoVT family DNA-binding domain-containing protein [Rubeoparvulum massiliense]